MESFVPSNKRNLRTARFSHASVARMTLFDQVPILRDTLLVDAFDEFSFGHTVSEY